MPLTAAKCPNCGGMLQVDASQRLAVCPFCKQPYVVEEAINNYITNYNIENMHAETVNIIGGKTADDFAKSGDTNMKLQRYSAAKNDFEKITNDYPYDYRGWWGLIRLETREFSVDGIKWSTLCQLREYYKNVLKVGNYPASIRNTYEQFDRKMTDQLKAESENLNARAAQIESKRKTAYDSMQSLNGEIALRQNNINNTEKKQKRFIDITDRLSFGLFILGFIVALIIEVYESKANNYPFSIKNLILGTLLIEILILIFMGVIIVPLQTVFSKIMYKKNQINQRKTGKLRADYQKSVDIINSEYEKEMAAVNIQDIHKVLGKKITYLEK
ncbi:MAG: hypothetical protein Q4C20_01400 [Erysipelotrichaceae bacterium]|nr:hypothetical protein [Erysipelotrichaceae bacterium]